MDHDLFLPAGGEGADFGRGSVFFVGNATVIIRYAGFTILTDPNFLHAGDHVHLGYGIKSTRLKDPAIEMDDLPPLDLVVLSHLHGDHFDRNVERDLDRTLPIVTTFHAARYLEGRGFRPPHALDTWEGVTVRKGEARLRITAMPGTHGPGPLGRLLPPVMGSMLEFGEADGETRLRLYITGDTLVHKRLREIPSRYPDIDLALLHLGGTRIFGVYVTMTGEQGVEALKITNPKTALPIHYDDYEAFESPLSDFQRAVVEAGLEDRVRYLVRGEDFEFEAPERR